MTDTFFHPVSGFDLPRFAGVATFMRLPHVALTDARIKDVEIGLIGVPWDGGTTNRSGPRHGPRQLRDMSTMIRAQNGATGVRPFEMANCADLGDVAPNPADLMETMARVTSFYERCEVCRHSAAHGRRGSSDVPARLAGLGQGCAAFHDPFRQPHRPV